MLFIRLAIRPTECQRDPLAFVASRVVPSPLTAADFPVVLVCVSVSVPLRATLLRLAEEPRLYTGALFK